MLLLFLNHPFADTHQMILLSIDKEDLLLLLPLPYVLRLQVMQADKFRPLSEPVHCVHAIQRTRKAEQGMKAILLRTYLAIIQAMVPEYILLSGHSMYFLLPLQLHVIILHKRKLPQLLE